MPNSSTLAVAAGCIVAAVQHYLDIGWWIWIVFTLALLMDIAAAQQWRKTILSATKARSTLLGYQQREER